jgi:hypothetical protein
MPQGCFLYYVPGVTKEQVTRDFIAGRPEAVPLFDLVHSPRLFSLHCHAANVSGGPDGKSGAVFWGQSVAADPTQRYGYYPDQQKWQKIGEQWIGYQADLLPGPSSLKRTAMIDGIEVEMGDHRVWLAAIIRPFHEASRTWRTNLPTVTGLNSEGKRERSVDKNFAALWELSGKIGSYMVDGLAVNELDFFSWAVQCLSANYRLDEATATILNLGSSNALQDVLKAAVDMELVLSFIDAEAPTASQNPPLESAPTNS